jgi:hypothetical protein
MVPRCITLILAGVLWTAAADPPSAQDAEAEKRELLFRRWEAILQAGWSDAAALRIESRPSLETNAAMIDLQRQWTRGLFDLMYIHSSFGLYWDEIPLPTIRGPEAIKGAERFVADHGWNMGTNMPPALWYTKQYGAPITGLPWIVIHGREFRATTLGGVLYVPLRYGPVFDGFACSGVAYNPATNRMPCVRAFKHLGDHWYLWQTGSPPEGPTIYEGQEGTGQQDGPANGSQPVLWETNQTSSAAGSRR